MSEEEEEEEYLSMLEDKDDEGFDDSTELCRCCNAYHKTMDDCDIDDLEESFT
jgi:hypothetical protein